LSSLTSPCLEYESGDDVFNFSKPRQIKSPRQETFDARALHPFDCLVVTLDTKAQRLLHQCKSTVICAESCADEFAQLSRLPPPV
jgi:hypothetical protein